MRIFLALCLVLFASTCWAQEPATKTAAKKVAAKADVEPKLREELKAFEPFVGTWVIDGNWKDGRPIWAKNVYTVGMDGNFVMAKTFVREGGQKEYQRYLTIWRWDKDAEKVVAHGFTHDGTYSETESMIDLSDEGKPSVSSVTSTKGSPVAIQQTVKLIDENSYSWKVSTSATKDAVIMDGVWKKQ
jgi:hypothetical protein